MSTWFHPRRLGVAAVAVVFLAGCSPSKTAVPASEQPTQATTPTAAPQIVTAKTAFWPMYTAAHNWASDVEVLRITSKEVAGFKNEKGKAAMWEAAFASPSQHTYRVYTYSIVDVPPDLYKGVTAGMDRPWGGDTRNAMPIDLSTFNVDSDAAYTTAAGDAGVWLKKNPGKDFSAMEVADTSKFPDPMWYVMWGTPKDGFAAWVDANTGALTKK